jgi:hypothetical protein
MTRSLTLWLQLGYAGEVRITDCHVESTWRNIRLVEAISGDIWHRTFRRFLRDWTWFYQTIGRFTVAIISTKAQWKGQTNFVRNCAWLYVPDRFQIFERKVHEIHYLTEASKSASFVRILVHRQCIIGVMCTYTERGTLTSLMHMTC